MVDFMRGSSTGRKPVIAMNSRPASSAWPPKILHESLALGVPAFSQISLWTAARARRSGQRAFS